MIAILNKHPQLDFFIGFFGGPEIPTKQDKFKPLNGYVVAIEEDGISQEFEAYIKKKDPDNLKAFEAKLQDLIKTELKEEQPYPKNVKLEVIVLVAMGEKRIKVVDVDNLVKAVLDCMRGLVYEDDSQIMNVLGSKFVNEFEALNGVMIGVRKITSHEDSWFRNIKLAYFEYKDEDGNPVDPPPSPPIPRKNKKSRSK